MSALHTAATQGRFDAVAILLSVGIRDHVDDRGFTALECAINAGHMHIAQILIEATQAYPVAVNDSIIISH